MASQTATNEMVIRIVQRVPHELNSYHYTNAGVDSYFMPSVLPEQPICSIPGQPPYIEQYCPPTPTPVPELYQGGFLSSNLPQASDHHTRYSNSQPTSPSFSTQTQYSPPETSAFDSLFQSYALWGGYSDSTQNQEHLTSNPNISTRAHYLVSELCKVESPSQSYSPGGGYGASSSKQDDLTSTSNEITQPISWYTPGLRCIENLGVSKERENDEEAVELNL